MLWERALARDLPASRGLKSAPTTTILGGASCPRGPAL